MPQACIHAHRLMPRHRFGLARLACPAPATRGFAQSPFSCYSLLVKLFAPGSVRLFSLPLQYSVGSIPGYHSSGHAGIDE